MKTTYTQAQLNRLPDNEIQGLWNDLAISFEEVKMNKPGATVGFFQLSRETERRGLQIDKDSYGKIILLPKVTDMEYCVIATEKSTGKKKALTGGLTYENANALRILFTRIKKERFQNFLTKQFPFTDKKES